MAKFADSLISRGLMLLGIAMMLTPLALWVAWTETIFVVVLVPAPQPPRFTVFWPVSKDLRLKANPPTMFGR